MRSTVVVAAVVAVALVGFAFILSGAAPAKVTSTLATTSASTASQSCPSIPSPRGNSSVTITATGGTWPSCDCALVASNSHGMVYISTGAKVGDLVCLAASLNDSDTVAFTITNSTGRVVFQSIACVGGGQFATPPSTGVSCEADWDTAAPDPQGNPIAPGTYTLAATDYQGSPIVLEANFTLG